MTTNNSVNMGIKENTDGGEISLGVTARILKWLGANITLTGSGTNVYTFPAATSTLIGDEDADWVDLTDGGATTLHSHAGATAAYPPGFWSGGEMTISGADTEHDISHAAGFFRDASNAVNMDLTVLIKRLDANWAVGTNQGGLDTGSVANSTWYYRWIIKRSDTGVVDVLYSASSSSPTMPANYDYKVQRGAFKTDSSGNIVGFYNYQNIFTWNTPVRDLSAGTQTAGTAVTVSCPLGKKMKIFGTVAVAGTANEQLWMWDPDLTGYSNAGGIGPMIYGSTTAPFFSFFEMVTNASAQVKYNVSSGAGYIDTAGWIEL